MELIERVRRGRLAISLAEKRGVDTSRWKHHLAQLMEEVWRIPERDEGFVPWILWEWRRVSIPDWRRILSEAIEQGDAGREEYARRMLREILHAED
jgi:hypothetical protein